MAYFELYKVGRQFWVPTAALYIERQAAHWLQAFRQSHCNLSWDMFTVAVLEEFGVDEFELVIHRLLQLCQTGSVSDYRVALDPFINSQVLRHTVSSGPEGWIACCLRLQAP